MCGCYMKFILHAAIVVEPEGEPRKLKFCNEAKL
jgi:hypothetical protein